LEEPAIIGITRYPEPVDMSTDGVITKLAEISDSLGTTGRCEWASRVERRARELSGDKEEKHISFHSDENREVMLSTDRRGKDCLLRAIRELYGSMPSPVQPFFQGVACVHRGEEVTPILYCMLV
jgi:hypothetical protein